MATDTSRATLDDGRVLTAYRERIEVTSNLPRPDAGWRFTDAAGHEHYYGEEGGYPTLIWVIDQDDYTLVEDGYSEEYPGTGHYECDICAERIAPGTVGPSTFREFIPGAVHYELDGQPITEEQYGEIVATFAPR